MSSINAKVKLIFLLILLISFTSSHGGDDMQFDNVDMEGLKEYMKSMPKEELEQMVNEYN